MTAQALDVTLELLSPGLAGRALRRDELHVSRVPPSLRAHGSQAARAATQYESGVRAPGFWQLRH